MLAAQGCNRTAQLPDGGESPGGVVSGGVVSGGVVSGGVVSGGVVSERVERGLESAGTSQPPDREAGPGGTSGSEAGVGSPEPVLAPAPTTAPIDAAPGAPPLTDAAPGDSGPTSVDAARPDIDASLLDASISPCAGSARAVVLVSVDGLASRHVEAAVEDGSATAFARLLAEGAGTLEGRTEARISVTIPNHTSMITGRPAVELPDFPPETPHGVVYNYDPGGSATVHDENPALGYATSVFDEVHDRGGRTLLYSSKDKFALYERSYTAPYARKDPYQRDHGDDKIGDFRYVDDSRELVPAFIEALARAVSDKPRGPTFAMLHIRETDTAGHGYGWDSAEYTEALLLADDLLGDLLDALSTDQKLRRTLLIVTTDHGGTGTGHSDHTDPLVYRIPFFVWGPGVPAGADLYQVSLGSRVNPGTEAPLDGVAGQPVRNGDAANLALSLLGLPAIEGSLHRGFLLDCDEPKPR